MKPKTKPTRVKATKAWASTYHTGDVEQVYLTKHPAAYVHEVAILDARDHAAREAELRRLRREIRVLREAVDRPAKGYANLKCSRCGAESAWLVPDRKGPRR